LKSLERNSLGFCGIRPRKEALIGRIDAIGNEKRRYGLEKIEAVRRKTVSAEHNIGFYAAWLSQHSLNLSLGRSLGCTRRRLALKTTLLSTPWNPPGRANAAHKFAWRLKG